MTSQKAKNTKHVEKGTFGGVAANRHQPALHGASAVSEVSLEGVLPAAGAHPGFTYHGGPVIKCSTVYASFWGDQWLNDPNALQRASRLSQFMKDLLASKYMNILSQYGAGSGAGAAGIFVRSGFISSVPNEINEGFIHSTIQACINAGAVPEPGNPSSMAFMIFLADSIAVNSANLEVSMCEPAGDSAFGYHYFFTTAAGHKFYYSVIPGLTDACLQHSCPSDAACSLHLAETQEQRQTQVASHEYAEMVTDPEITAWWDSAGGENGDICNGESALITVGSNTWTVQRMYSKFDDMNTNGAVQCVVEPANPIPKLAGGPASSVSADAQVRLLSPTAFDRLLPLPAFHFDVKTQEHKIDRRALNRYTRSLFHPMEATQVVGDLPSFLELVATSLRG